MAGAKQLLELTWFNKDKALIPSEEGRYAYEWVDPKDPRYCETRALVVDEVVTGKQSPKDEDTQYSERADLDPTEDNLLILGESGDVLEALTRVPELREKYLGKVKCIYIDPPFNTAQTFADYEDNLEHSVWLTMMRDRLVHLRKLLSDDGSIWVHLDDVENHRMRLLMDEVFGSGNFVAEVIWEKNISPKNSAKYLSVDHDVILLYSKNKEAWLPNSLPRTAKMNALSTPTRIATLAGPGLPVIWWRTNPIRWDCTASKRLLAEASKGRPRDGIGGYPSKHFKSWMQTVVSGGARMGTQFHG